MLAHDRYCDETAHRIGQLRDVVTSGADRDAAALDRWLAESGEPAVGAPREAGPDTPVWAWAGVPTAGFRARRMTHETTVHRAGATLAAELPYEVAPDIAADALDEWLRIVEWVRRGAPGGPAADPRGPGRSPHLHATDTDPALNAEWLVEPGAGGVRRRRGHEKATVALRGPLTRVLLAFYRRLPLDGPGLEVPGDRELPGFRPERATFG